MKPSCYFEDVSARALHWFAVVKTPKAIPELCISLHNVSLGSPLQIVPRRPTMHKGILDKNEFFATNCTVETNCSSSSPTWLSTWTIAVKSGRKPKIVDNPLYSQSHFSLFPALPPAPSLHFKIPQAAATSNIFCLFLAVCLMWEAPQTAHFSFEAVK